MTIFSSWRRLLFCSIQNITHRFSIALIVFRRRDSIFRIKKLLGKVPKQKCIPARLKGLSKIAWPKLIIRKVRTKKLFSSCWANDMLNSASPRICSIPILWSTYIFRGRINRKRKSMSSILYKKNALAWTSRKNCLKIKDRFKTPKN